MDQHFQRVRGRTVHILSEKQQGSQCGWNGVSDEVIQEQMEKEKEDHLGLLVQCKNFVFSLSEEDVTGVSLHFSMIMLPAVLRIH